MNKNKLFSTNISHEKLGYSRTIVGSSKAILTLKARRQKERWQKIYKRKLNALKVNAFTQTKSLNNSDPETIARALSKAAEQEIKALSSVWKSRLSESSLPSWNSLLGKPPSKPDLVPLREKPDVASPKYQTKLGFIDKLSKRSREEKQSQSKLAYEQDVADWAAEMKQLNQKNNRLKDEVKKRSNEWKSAKESIERSITMYKGGETGAVLDHCDLILFQSKLPDLIPKVWRLHYQPETKTLAIDFQMPCYSDMPKTEVAETDPEDRELSVTELAESTKKQLYSNLLYQVSLRVIDEQLTADKFDMLDKVVFNGYITDNPMAMPATSRYIMSIAITKSDFDYLRHTDVSPEKSYYNLGGVGKELYEQVAIEPIQKAQV